MLIYFPGDNVAFSTAKILFQRTHFAQFSDEATQSPKFISQTVNFNECLSYSEIYMEVGTNSAIMLQSKLEAN